MKSNYFLLICIFIFIGCTPSSKSHNIEEKFYIKEKNNSSYDIFYQFYLEDGNVYRVKLPKNRESNPHEPYTCYPDKYPYWSYKNNPYEVIKKIIIADLYSRKILKRIEGKDIENTYKLNKFDSVYGDRVKYYLFEITDEWLEN